jgi:dipeptidyl aminopeptidase/acylaminoacyl peptidase
LGSPFLHRARPATLTLSFLGLLVPLGFAQNTPPAKIDVMVVPDIAIQTEDYAEARKTFHTKLLRKGSAPHQEDCKDSQPPVGVAEVFFPSNGLNLRAWLNRPSLGSNQKYPAVLFLHGGFCFDASDWEETKAFQDAGFIVMLPNRRGENGQPGNFTMFYDEVDDVISAAEYLRQQSFIDKTRLYVAGSSTGGALTMLAALTYPHFRAAASFSGSPDAVGYTRHAVAIGAESDVPFDYRDARELQLRSAKAYATSFKCPTRMYYGTEEKNFAISTQPSASLAREHRLDVQAVAVEGGHTSAEDAEIKMAIAFFREAK